MNYKILLIVLLFSSPIYAQKYDFQWLFGYKTNPDIVHPDFGRSVMDFNTTPIDIYYENQNINLDITNVSMCDSSGNLLFYTNGIVVANHLNEVMENGYGLNPGAIANSFSDYGYPNVQGAVVLPLPKTDSIYYLFHQRIEYATSNISTHGSTLFLSVVNMSENNGLGKVISKNEILVNDTLETGNLTATRHANGRDWWITNSKYDSNQFYTFLLTPEGVENHGIQEVGMIAPTGLGQAVFSPDGSKYAKVDLVSAAVGNFLNVYDFDRCTGELSNHIQIVNYDTLYSGGVAISPNSRFLYLSSFTYVVQFDLWASDIVASGDTVAIYDGFTDSIGFATTFFMAQLGPDGKIYINVNNGVKHLHVINSPDSIGVACDLQQHSLELPTYNAFSLPNFPNYRLGALEGSPCDTIETASKDILLLKNEINIYPNPAEDFITLEWENVSKESSIVLFNALGQVVFSKKLAFEEKQQLHIEKLSEGVYFYMIDQGTQKVKSGKLLILRR